MVYTQTYAQWRGLTRPGRAIGRVTEVVKHTEAGAAISPNATVAQEVARCRAIDNFHRSLGWAGIGYSAMDFPSGRIYEARGWFRSGAHTQQGRNTRALAICTAGHGDRTAMTEAGIAGVRRWIGEGIRVGALTPNPQISGHRNYANKSCPGNLIYPQLHRLRGVRGPGSAPAPTPAPQPPEDDMALVDDGYQRQLQRMGKAGALTDLERMHADLFGKHKASPTSLGHLLRFYRGFRERLPTGEQDPTRVGHYAAAGVTAGKRLADALDRLDSSVLGMATGAVTLIRAHREEQEANEALDQPDADPPDAA